MKVQILKNRFEKEQIETNISFEQLENILRNPLKKPKEQCPLWRFCSVFNNKQNSRLQENIEDINSLLLDFDDNLTIKEFLNKYSDINFYLYTTTSHSKDQDKFRVIVPLKEKYNYKNFKNPFLIDSLCEYFENVDPSSFSNFHNLPNMCKKPNEYFFFHNISENFFDLNSLNNRAKYKERLLDISMQCRNLKNKSKPEFKNTMSENARIAYENKVKIELRKELNKISNFRNGTRYNSLLSLTGKMCNAKFPDNSYIFDLPEILQWITSNCSDRNVIKMVENLYNKRM